MTRDITDKVRLEDFLPPMPDFEKKQLPEALRPGDGVDSRRFRILESKRAVLSGKPFEPFMEPEELDASKEVF